MSQQAMSVSWDAYQNNLCRGLSSLQQRGEFVDMTLAADGHMVRVHRMVMSLISPYIKQLITSADCTNPVIFLNKVSYKTLCSLLDYAYTGEVQVPREDLNEFIEAGKALVIKGIAEMNVDHTLSMLTAGPYVRIQHSGTNSTTTIRERTEDKHEYNTNSKPETTPEISSVFVDENSQDDDMDTAGDDDFQEYKPAPTTPKKTIKQPVTEESSVQKPIMQYSISNQGNLQMVLNRFLYYLVYTGKTSGHRRWQCIDNHSKRTKCQAAVITKNDVIVQRKPYHCHQPHDKKLRRKTLRRKIYRTFAEAQVIGEKVRRASQIRKRQMIEKKRKMAANQAEAAKLSKTS